MKRLLPALGGLLFLPTAFAASQAAFTFSPGNLENWTQVAIPDATGNDYRFFATAATFGGRITWNDPVGSIGGVIVTSATNTDARDVAHKTAILRSPTFSINWPNTEADLDITPTQISFKLLAGSGSATGPTNVSDIPASTVATTQSNSYLGVGLRRVGDDAYLLWGRRTSNAQNNSWQTITWNEATLAAAIASDPPGTLYTLDLIDGAQGSWSWVAMDSLTMIDARTVTYVSVTPEDTQAAESGDDQLLSVRFTRDGDLTNDLDVIYALGGTAQMGVDFDPLVGDTGAGTFIVRIPAGQESADVWVPVIQNGKFEPDRALQFTIRASPDYVIGSLANARVWISDLPPVGSTSVSGPLPTGTYLPFRNPLLTSTSGSLFFYGEAVCTGGYLTAGIWPTTPSSSSTGGVDIGRNTASAGGAIFNYFDHKGEASGNARVAATPNFPIGVGRYTILCEIQFQDVSSGSIRAWFWDGLNGSFDYQNPSVVTSFTSGFTTAGDFLYLRLDGSGAGTIWTNGRALWVDGADPSQLAAAFAQLTPARPFLMVDATGAGEFGDSRNLMFSIFRSGVPGGEFDVNLAYEGTADETDFVSMPSVASFTAGESRANATLEVRPDDLYEGPETLAVRIENSSAWLVTSPLSPAATVADRPFQAWMFANLPALSTDGPQSDTDGDGWVNLLEYFSGTGLNDAATRGFAQLVPGTGDTLSFQRDPSRTDVGGSVQWSTDLQHWKQSGESDEVRTILITEEVTPSTTGGPDTVEARAEVTAGEAPERLFLRLSVDLP